MFNRIPSDVLEIVVVYSRSYDLFIELKEIVTRFKDKCIETRVRDKLTEKRVYDYGIYFVLDNYANREYNKPYYVGKLCTSRIYQRYSDRLYIDLPICVGIKGLRAYTSRVIDSKGSEGLIFLIRNNRFYQSGYRVINHKGVNILEL